MKKTYLYKFIFILGVIVGLSGADLNSGGGEGKFKSGSEPDGFRGIKWGTDILKDPDLQVYSKIGNSEIRYQKVNENLNIGDANVAYIHYRARPDGSFLGVDILAEGEDNWKKIREYIVDKFGPYYSIYLHKHQELLLWGSKTVLVTLANYHSSKSQITLLGIMYIEKVLKDDKEVGGEAVLKDSLYEPCDLNQDGQCNEYDQKLYDSTVEE